MTAQSGSEYLTYLRRRWPAVILLTLVGLGVAVALTLSSPKRYTATSEVYVSANTGRSAQDLYTASSFTQSQMQSYASLVTTDLILSPVASAYRVPGGVGALASDISTSVSTTSVIMDISVTAASPSRAAALANAVAASLAQKAPRLDSVRRTRNASPVKITTVQAASPPSSPSSPKTKLNLLLGGFIGLVCGILYAVLRGTFDVRLKTPDDVQALTSLPLLAAVPEAPNLKSGLVFGEGGPPPLAEAYRMLRTGLQFVHLRREEVHTILLTSSVPSEGKTLTSLNVAAAFAESGRHTLLLEADLRRPGLARQIGSEQEVGLTDALIGAAELDDAIVEPEHLRGLSILQAGSIPPNPSELLSSSEFDNVLRQLQSKFETIIIDSPPLGLVTDAAVLASRADIVVLVVAAGRVRKAELQRALHYLEMVRMPSGFVMNRVKTSRLGRTNYYGGYYGNDNGSRGLPQEAKQGVLPGQFGR